MRIEELPSEYIGVASLSYGKDSIAMLEAVKELGLPLDRIVHAEVWATDTIPADLPPMVEFKQYADKIIKQRYGVTVEHLCAMTTPDKKHCSQTVNVERERERAEFKLTYEDAFYRKFTSTITSFGKQYQREKGCEYIYGFPHTTGAWCKGRLKTNVIRETNISRYILQTDEQKFEQDSGGVLRIPTQECAMVQRRTQEGCYTDSQSTKGLGATVTSNPLYYGFPINKGNWCTELKRRVFKKGGTRA